MKDINALQWKVVLTISTWVAKPVVWRKPESFFCMQVMIIFKAGMDGNYRVVFTDNGGSGPICRGTLM